MNKPYRAPRVYEPEADSERERIYTIDGRSYLYHNGTLLPLRSYYSLLTLSGGSFGWLAAEGAIGSPSFVYTGSTMDETPKPPYVGPEIVTKGGNTEPHTPSVGDAIARFILLSFLLLAMVIALASLPWPRMATWP